MTPREVEQMTQSEYEAFVRFANQEIRGREREQRRMMRRR